MGSSKAQFWRGPWKAGTGNHLTHLDNIKWLGQMIFSQWLYIKAPASWGDLGPGEGWEYGLLWLHQKAAWLSGKQALWTPLLCGRPQLWGCLKLQIGNWTIYCSMFPPTLCVCELWGKDYILNICIIIWLGPSANNGFSTIFKDWQLIDMLCGHCCGTHKGIQKLGNPVSYLIIIIGL